MSATADALGLEMPPGMPRLPGEEPPVPRRGLVNRLWRNPTIAVGAGILALILLMGLAAPLLTAIDPAQINPAFRNKQPGADEVVRRDDGSSVTVTHWMGTDSLGRDIYSRVVYGARASLLVGASVALISVAVGLLIGLVGGYIRWLDAIVMRIMDGLMAIPAILLAIAVVSLSKAGLVAVIVAIVVPEIPRVVRLVRSVVLSVREEPYVEAAISVGTPTPLLIVRHVLPNTIAPLIVQATYIAASAILIEAILSFLGVGIPPETPTWGNIMAEGRTLFRVFPHNILFPGICLALTVLAVNMLGDGLRDTLDPRLRKQL
ncbi:MAG: ABC transporter permease [Betaproteobacteria bacterium]